MNNHQNHKYGFKERTKFVHPIFPITTLVSRVSMNNNHTNLNVWSNIMKLVVEAGCYNKSIAKQE